MGDITPKNEGFEFSSNLEFEQCWWDDGSWSPRWMDPGEFPGLAKRLYSTSPVKHHVSPVENLKLPDFPACESTDLFPNAFTTGPKFS